MSAEVELFALESGRVERPYSVGEVTEWPIRLKTSLAPLSTEALAPFTEVRVRSVWLMGPRHTDRDIALVADFFAELDEVYVPVAAMLTDDAIRALVRHGDHFRSFGVLRSRVTDAGAAILASFPELRQVRLEHSRITDAGVAELGACRNLEVLNLDGNRDVKGSGFSSFVDHPSLRALFLRGTQVDDDGVGHLSGCAELRDLWLSSTRVTERCLLTLPHNPNLEVSLPRELDRERVDAVRRDTDFMVDGLGPDHVLDIPRSDGGAPVELPAQLRSNALTFAVFTASWCQPCHWLKTTFESVRPNLREQFRFVELDVDEYLALASSLQIRSVPTAFVMQFGIELDRFVGALGVEKLTERLEAVLAL